jgi:hypothetical protein
MGLDAFAVLCCAVMGWDMGLDWMGYGILCCAVLCCAVPYDLINDWDRIG